MGALLGIGALAYYFWMIFTNPYSPLNPFPPAQIPTVYHYITATPTNTIIPREATWTSTATTQPLPTRTKAPTWTLLPEMVTPFSTSTSIPATIGTPVNTTTPLPASAEITYLASTDFHPDKNCEWLGVAGKVLGTDGKPLPFQEIQLGGTLDGKNVSLLDLEWNRIGLWPVRV